MKIVLTNDDGPHGPGLSELRRALTGLGEVTVVCPAQERSGVGHAITYLAPLRVGTVRLADGTEARTLSGTPADCVKFALLELLDSPPELVVSGPNVGINAGADLFYSGTVAAALEGGLYGLRSVAFSTNPGNADRIESVAQQALRVLRLLPADGCVFNVNIPLLGEEEPGVRFTRQSPAPPGETYTRQQDPRGRPHYWLGSSANGDPPAPDTDVAAVAAGCISITPLRPDLTDMVALERLGRDALGRPGGLRA